jgi:hypothetical protein
MKNVKFSLKALVLTLATLGLVGSPGRASVGETQKPTKLPTTWEESAEGCKPHKFNNYDSWNVFFRPIV